MSTPSLPEHECDTRRDEPQRPDDVGDGHQHAGKPPSRLLEGSGELEGPDDQSQTEHDSWPSQPCREDIALDHCDPHEQRPEPGEEIAEVLADGDTEGAMERLEDDGHRVTG